MPPCARQPVDDRAHRVLADAEGDVAPHVYTRELAGPLERGLGRLDQVGRAASHGGRVRADRGHRLLSGRARRNIFPCLEARQGVLPAIAQTTRPGSLPLLDELGVALATRPWHAPPIPPENAAPGLQQAHVLVYTLVHIEVQLGIEAHRKLCRAHLVFTQRRAVGFGGVDRVGRRVGDVGAHLDERRPLGFRARDL